MGPAAWTSKDAMDLLFFKTVMRWPLTLCLRLICMPAGAGHGVLLLLEGHTSSLSLCTVGRRALLKYVAPSCLVLGRYAWGSRLRLGTAVLKSARWLS
jgi:hypothetical protein